MDSPAGRAHVVVTLEEDDLHLRILYEAADLGFNWLVWVAFIHLSMTQHAIG